MIKNQHLRSERHTLCDCFVSHLLIKGAELNMHFEKVTAEHIDVIFQWLAQPFVQKFWDNTLAHKKDILNFVTGRKIKSTYADGKYVYWIAKRITKISAEPFAMLMTIQETEYNPIDEIKLAHLSKHGNTYGIDFMIGNSDYCGKGFGSKTLMEFIEFFRQSIDPCADTFLIDPSIDNLQAKHVYLKAGFEHVGDFVMQGNSSGSGKMHHLLVKNMMAFPEIGLTTKG